MAFLMWQGYMGGKDLKLIQSINEYDTLPQTVMSLTVAHCIKIFQENTQFTACSIFMYQMSSFYNLFGFSFSQDLV